MKDKLGSTNDYPQGKLKDDDRGGLKLAIGAFNDKVIMEFGEPIKWIGFDVEQARQIASLLMYRATEIEKEQRKNGSRPKE